MSGNTQKALFLKSKLGKLEVGTRGIPKPGPGELLVKIRATALNPVDWKIQKYGVFITVYPAVLGTDIAGEVEGVGEGIESFKKGDRVFSQGTWDSDGASFQQYTVTTAATTAKIPLKLSYEDAATLPVGFTAAYVGLYNNNPHGLGLATPVDSQHQHKYKGKAIVILGGPSSVGQYVIQLAKLSGFSFIITTASTKHTDFLKSLGSTHILDRNLDIDSLNGEIKKITSAPINTVYDAISSKATQQTGHDLLIAGGSLITVLELSIEKLDNIQHIQVMGILRLPPNQNLLKDLYSKFTRLLEEGKVTPNRFEVISGGLHGIIGGLQRLENDQVSGTKLVARPWEA